ncbi:hypothetical protein EBL87_09005 [Cereibacter sphaeroides]|nr:hypothetical protein EBL87_09005 [Cereibacter sphaeroides]AZB68211.1 hypothetical protein EBL86_07465 [Cereibacter sphaeroides]
MRPIRLPRRSRLPPSPRLPSRRPPRSPRRRRARPRPRRPPPRARAPECPRRHGRICRSSSPISPCRRACCGVGPSCARSA